MATYGATEIGGKVFTSPKDPSDIVVYRMDFSEELETGETIATRIVSLPEEGLTKDNDVINGDYIDVTVSSGTAGRRYPVVVTILTTEGRQLSRTGYIMVENL